MKDLLLRALLPECCSPGYWSLFMMLRLSGALSLLIKATGTRADKYLRRFFNESHCQSQEHYLTDHCFDARSGHSRGVSCCAMQQRRHMLPALERAQATTLSVAELAMASKHRQARGHTASVRRPAAPPQRQSAAIRLALTSMRRIQRRISLPMGRGPTGNLSTILKHGHSDKLIYHQNWARTDL
jgi:hypothetical protein